MITKKDYSQPAKAIKDKHITPGTPNMVEVNLEKIVNGINKTPDKFINQISITPSTILISR
jgi:hypothetical protein